MSNPAPLVFLALALSVPAQARERLDWSAGWRFTQGDPADASVLRPADFKPWLLAGAATLLATAPPAPPAGPAPGEALAYAQPGFDDAGWRLLDLPHDWGVETAFQQALPGETGKLPWQGVAWYRKRVPGAPAGQRTVLEIDGALANSAVYCNGRLVGGWPYGYTSYQVDLTGCLNPGADNSLAIRLDNPAKSSRWYPGGGLYRHVWLTHTGAVHVPAGQVFVRTPEASAARATVAVRVAVANARPAPVTVGVTVDVYRADANGRPVGVPLAPSREQPRTLNAGERTAMDFDLRLARPALWDVAAPQRHVAVTVVKQGGRVLDRVETPFGIRSIAFTADDGFHLNGRRVQLNGVCMHHDLGALGAAFNVRAAERQLELLREMGVNAIRTSHNPPAPELLELTDRMGFLVIDELLDTWTQAKKPQDYHQHFADWSEADLRAWVRRDRNHPSVILWSTGNEIHEQGMPQGRAVSARLAALVNAEDPTRLITVGANVVDAGFNGFQRTVGAFGYNYKPHEYARFHTANPTQPLYGSETASTVSSRGEYLFPVSDNQAQGLMGYHVSSYDLSAPPWATTPDTEFRAQDRHRFVAGEFVWTGFDYLGEPTPFNDDATNLLNFHTSEERERARAEIARLGRLQLPSRSAYFGILDLAGFKKDRFYLYQARWRPDLPMAHILPHWNWPERVGLVTPVHVYTSGDEAELFLNGRSLGRRQKAEGEYRLRWNDVVYEPGELVVVAYKAGKEWARSLVATTGAADGLQLAADRAAITADGRDLAFVTATVADAAGRAVPRSKPLLSFTLDGPGEIVATDNGDPTDHTAFKSTERRAFNALGLAIVKLKAGATGPVLLRVTSEGLKPAEVVIRPR
ncbi:MAG: glycoside hydrolase family 2 protein [Burkholderiales bacterium]|nr:glycoside hydrolase family 2 protein [Burkholderiales bacterium]